ncbi:MAG: hypothetical protein JJT78_01885 [Leptospira sp.]|nr:hypothetical protein [Leptospira sp.]
MVLSKSDETGEISYKRVVNTFIRQTQAIYKVSFEDGTILETTWNHPFRRLKLDATLLGGLQDSTSNVNQSMDLSEWTEAKELKSGDLTFTADGKLLAISSIEVDGREETVYNFEVEDFHTYFVGEVGVWVHNENYLQKLKNLVKSGQFKSDNKIELENIEKTNKESISKYDEMMNEIRSEELDSNIQWFSTGSLTQKFMDAGYRIVGFGKQNATEVGTGLAKGDHGVFRGEKGVRSYIDENGHEIIDTSKAKKDVIYYLNDGSYLKIKPGNKEVNIHKIRERSEKEERTPYVDKIFYDKNKPKTIAPPSGGTR